MTSSKTTKRALFSSVVALLLCFAMLMGTTMAWFTDSVSNGVNKIQSGNLDVKLLHQTYGYSSQYAEVTETTPLFLNVDGQPLLWEPGAGAAEDFWIKNEGSLALKYQFKVEFANATATPEGKTLADILEIDMIAFSGNYTDPQFLPYDSVLIEGGFVEGYLLPGEHIRFFTTINWFPSDIDNEFNVEGGLSVDLGVSLVATQYTYEKDAEGDQYDKNAEYPVVDIGYLVDSGSDGGITWTLTDTGVLSIAPAATTVADPNCGKEFDVGAWREAVVYNAEGKGIAVGGYPYDVNAVTSLVIEDGVTSIGSFTAKFPNLTGEVVIPASVTYIGQEAFQNTKITKLTFAKGGTEELCIAPGAFKNMAIEELVLPDDRPVHIHAWAFNNNMNLKRITIPATVTSFPGPIHVEYWYNGTEYTGASYDSQVFKGCPAIESITFGSKAVHDAFFAAHGNQININGIGDVEIIINN